MDTIVKVKTRVYLPFYVNMTVYQGPHDLSALHEISIGVDYEGNGEGFIAAYGEDENTAVKIYDYILDIVGLVMEFPTTSLPKLVSNKSEIVSYLVKKRLMLGV